MSVPRHFTAREIMTPPQISALQAWDNKRTSYTIDQSHSSIRRAFRNSFLPAAHADWPKIHDGTLQNFASWKEGIKIVAIISKYARVHVQFLALYYIKYCMCISNDRMVEVYSCYKNVKGKIGAQNNLTYCFF
jgi:hypothetical protein